MSDTSDSEFPTPPTPGVPDGTSTDGFTEDEKLTLTMLPSLIGSAVAFSAKSGPVGTVKEMMANARSAAEGRRTFPDNSLINSILPDLDDVGEAMDRAKSLQAAQLERLKEAGITSAEEMKGYVLTQVGAAREVLSSKADQVEAAQYKEWVVGVADSVAKAAKEGGFFGIGGEQVSESETETIDAIQRELGD